ncbi:MAG: Fic family protein [Flavobacteriales bacterium]|nr:Fic family protein [Flavobacteriales bacterium]
MDLKIVHTELLPAYLEAIPTNLAPKFDALKDAEISTDSFGFYTSVSSVFSSKIEGEEIELDSYVKHKRFGIQFLPDYTKKIDDLYDAYLFAQTHVLNKPNVDEVHRLLAKNFVQKQFLGNTRTQNMFVSSTDGKIEYVAASPQLVNDEMTKFYHDLEVLLQDALSVEEVFFYASMLHLIFVKIHPWSDGNGRSARLLEKWFIAQKLGQKAWFLQSEKNYYQQHQTYYNNLRVLGLEYPELDYSKALPFLLMLPDCLKLNE